MAMTRLHLDGNDANPPPRGGARLTVGPMQITIATTGARSRRTRTATLYAWEDGNRLVIVGSRGGAARNPAWVHNLRTEPRLVVGRGKESKEMVAREVTDVDERERLWQLVVARFPLYATYQRRKKRQIPLFVLE
jgi:deazaflavin-dependent oxidoreductase (nitroreductase family)